MIHLWWFGIVEIIELKATGDAEASIIFE